MTREELEVLVQEDMGVVEVEVVVEVAVAQAAAAPVVVFNGADQTLERSRRILLVGHAHQEVDDDSVALVSCF